MRVSLGFGFQKTRIKSLPSVGIVTSPTPSSMQTFSSSENKNANYSAYAMLFLAPFILSPTTSDAQQKDNKSQPISVQIGEKAKSKKDYTYYRNSKYDNTDSVVYANGKIENFRQGTTPDCSLLSVLKAISLTPEGKKMLKEIIIPLSDGSFDVDLCIDSDSALYSVSRKEFFDSKNSTLSTLDDDTKIIEIATKKYCEDIGQKFELSIEDALWLITCNQCSEKVSTESSKNAFVEKNDDTEQIDPNAPLVYEFFNYIMDLDKDDLKNSLLMCSTKDKNPKYGLFENHAYYITNMRFTRDEDYNIDGVLYLNNPHCTECKPKKITLQQFMETMNGVYYLNLK